MEFTSIVQEAIPYLLALLILVGVWAVVEIALTLRRARVTLDGVDKTVDTAKGTIDKATPLIEHATLTVDAANLEILRVDDILEDVSNVTKTASNVSDTVETVTQAPQRVIATISEAMRGGARARAKQRDDQRVLATEAGSAKLEAAGDGAYEPPACPANDAAASVADAPAAAGSAGVVADASPDAGEAAATAAKKPGYTVIQESPASND